MMIRKGMKAEGIINKEDILFVEAKLSERFKPYRRYSKNLFRFARKRFLILLPTAEIYGIIL